MPKLLNLMTCLATAALCLAAVAAPTSTPGNVIRYSGEGRLNANESHEAVSDLWMSGTSQYYSAKDKPIVSVYLTLDKKTAQLTLAFWTVDGGKKRLSRELACEAFAITSDATSEYDDSSGPSVLRPAVAGTVIRANCLEPHRGDAPRILLVTTNPKWFAIVIQGPELTEGEGRVQIIHGDRGLVQQ